MAGPYRESGCFRIILGLWMSGSRKGMSGNWAKAQRRIFSPLALKGEAIV
jgi:hypothetical protein